MMLTGRQIPLCLEKMYFESNRTRLCVFDAGIETPERMSFSYDP